jgi:hypothetical protein
MGSLGMACMVPAMLWPCWQMVTFSNIHCCFPQTHLSQPSSCRQGATAIKISLLMTALCYLQPPWNLQGLLATHNRRTAATSRAAPQAQAAMERLEAQGHNKHDEGPGLGSPAAYQDSQGQRAPLTSRSRLLPTGGP